MKAGRLQEALSHLQKARKASPGDADILYDLGHTLAKMKKRKDARRCFRRVLKLDPKYFWAWYDLACPDALERRPAGAFRNLYKSSECGFKDANYLLRDSDFKSIHKDPRWKVVLDCLSNRATDDELNHAPNQVV
jgi:tetratricopeptide (TPR) repeat protein